MKKTHWIILLLLFGKLLLAQESDYKIPDNPEELGKKLNEMANSLHTIEADFVQEKHMDFLQMAIKSKGKFYFKKNNQLRWEYNDPYLYVIIINDGKLIIHDEGKNTEIKVKGNKIFQQVNDIIIASVKGEIMDDDRFNVTLLENQDYYLVKLLPKASEMSEIIKEMHMFFDKETISVSKIKMVEPTNDYTLINFKNKKINEPISSDIFSVN